MKRLASLILFTVLLASCSAVCTPLADLDDDLLDVISRLEALGLSVDSIGELLELYEKGDLDEWAGDVDGAREVLADLQDILLTLAGLCTPDEPGLTTAKGPAKVRYAGVVVTVPRE